MKFIYPKCDIHHFDYITLEIAIKLTKDTFERKLAKQLNLTRVSAPLFVDKNSGLNDELNGFERSVVFDIKETGNNAEIVHSLAKWKRKALGDYEFKLNTGLYTDMNAIRRDEELSNIHSIYVDQWDWEKIITKEDRRIEVFQNHVSKIVKALKETEEVVCDAFIHLDKFVEENVTFITSQQLLDLYPDLTPKQREYEITKKHKTVCIMQIGNKLSNGTIHDGRAADYDDWQLNGDILVYYPVLDIALEISSMGIRVDENSLVAQLEERGQINRLVYPYHQALLNKELPYTIGGGIGQSRLCLLLLNRAHIGEVQASIWDEETQKIAKEIGIKLL